MPTCNPMRIILAHPDVAAPQRVNVAPAENSLQYSWDDAVVAVLEKQLEADQPQITARKLEGLYPATSDLTKWKPSEPEQIAWDSHQLAETEAIRAGKASAI